MLGKYLPNLVRPAGLREPKQLFISLFLPVCLLELQQMRGRCVGGLYRGRDPSYPPSSTRVIAARYEAVGSKQASGHCARRGWSTVMSTVRAHDLFKNGGVEKQLAWRLRQNIRRKDEYLCILIRRRAQECLFWSAIKEEIGFSEYSARRVGRKHILIQKSHEFP